MKRPWLLSLLLLTGCAGAQAASPDQRYRLVGEQDVASWLVLHPDGRFDYMLAAGALDEQAQGRWSSDGKTIRLTTEPKPKLAVFSAGPAGRTSRAPLTIKVTWPDGRGIAGINFRLIFDRGEQLESYSQEDGWSLDPAEQRIPRTIELSVPMHRLRSAPFPIDAAKANQLAFVLTPNDLGVVDFENVPLTVGKGRLVMHREGRDLTYVSQK